MIIILTFFKLVYTPKEKSIGFFLFLNTINNLLNRLKKVNNLSSKSRISFIKNVYNFYIPVNLFHILIRATDNIQLIY